MTTTKNDDIILLNNVLYIVQFLLYRLLRWEHTLIQVILVWNIDDTEQAKEVLFVVRDEQELIMRYRAGDAIAFEKLVRLYEKKVYNIAYSMLDNKEDALDICQEVFIKVYKSMVNFKGNAVFYTWLYRVTVNTCVDFIRKKKAYKYYYLDKELETGTGNIRMELIDTSKTPEEVMYEKELESIVTEAVRRLPEEQRSIVILRDFQQLSYSEISRTLNCSLSMVKNRLHRGRSALKQILTSKETDKSDIGGSLWRKVN